MRLSSRVFSSAVSKMRACVVREFGAPSQITVSEDHPKPQLSADNQVLIKVHAAGINPVDTYIRSGQYARLPQLPYTPGRDGAGIVEQVGSSITGLSVGDRVWFTSTVTGSSAELAVAEHAFPLPDAVSFQEGACLGIPYLTAFRALFVRCGAVSGQRVLIHGASGGVGLAACQIGSAYGLHMVGTAGTEEGCALVKHNGAEQVFNHREEGYVEQLKQAVPDGFDVIVEMLANVNLDKDLQLIGKKGKIAIVGNRGEISINPRALMAGESQILGVALNMASRDELCSTGRAVSALLTESSLRPVIDRVYSLDQLPQAHTDIIQSKGAKGNLVLTI